MNRSSKITIAGGVAIALLAGGAGTFARWYAEQDLTNDVIATGNLSLELTGSEWLINTVDGSGTVAFDPATETIVPGDVVTYTADVVPHLEGKNLEATLTANLEGTGLGQAYITDSNEPGKINVDVDIVDASGATVDTLTEAEDGEAYEAIITITFPEYAAEGANWGDQLQNESFSLDNMTLELAQNER